MLKGLLDNLSLDSYLALDAYGSSDLRAFRIGPPAMVPWKRANREEHTDATRLGTAAHCAILEPAAFESRFAHKPAGMKFSTKEGIAWRDDPCRAGMEILSDDDWNQIGAIVNAFHSKEIAAESLRSATGREVTAIWQDPDTGLWLKARPDYYRPGVLTDLKITRHASAQALAFKAYAEGWMHQLAHHRAGLIECGVPVKTGRLVAINPEPPQAFRVFCVEVKESALDLLHMENEKTIAAMAECERSGSWPGSPDSWDLIDLPPAALAAMLTVDWGSEEMTPETAKRGWR